jgi:hypothetical protein
MVILGGLSSLIALIAALALHVGSAMSFILYSLATMTGLGMVMAVAYPWLLVCRKEQVAPDLAIQAKRHAVMSAFVVLVMVCGAFQISLIYHAANVLVVLLAVACGLSLALFSFRLNLRLFHIPFVGPLSVAGWVLVAFFLLLGLIDDSPRAATLGDNTVCTEYDWGWGGSDAGRTVDVFKRYLVFDRLVESQTDVYTNPGAQPPTESEAINRCDVALSKTLIPR